MHILFLTQTTVQGASSRARVYEWLGYLDKENIKYTVRPGVPEKLDRVYHSHPTYFNKILWFLLKVLDRIVVLPQLKKYDIVVLQRETLPYFYPLLDKLIVRLARYSVFDFDDAIFEYYKKKTLFKRLILYFKSVEKIISNCDAVITSTPYLEAFAKKYNSNVTVVPTCIDPLVSTRPKRFKDGPIVIGWIGSNSTREYLNEIIPVLKRLSESFEIVFRLVGVEGFYVPGLNVECLPWNKKDEWQYLQSFDIGVMPLPDNPWTRGKAGYKLLQYMTAGVPVVASAVGFNKEIIQHGENGYLATSLDEWEICLISLIQDAEIYEGFSKNGLETVRNRFSFDVNAVKWLNALKGQKEVKPVNVMQVTTSSDIGGAENLVLKMMAHKSDRVNYTLVCLKGEGILIQEAAKYNVPGYLLNLYNPFSLYKLGRIIKKHKIGLVQTHGITAQVITLFFKRRRSVPVISTLHGIHDFENPIKSWLFKVTQKDICQWISVTKTGADQILEKYNLPVDKVAVIYNGIQPIDVTKVKKDGKIKVLTVANLKKIKGHITLLQTAKLFKDRGNTSIQFVFLGRDDMNGKLESQVEILGVSDMIEFAGFHTDVKPWYQNADIFCLPSWSEGMPVSILEAMSAGLVVIATQVGGIPELIEHEHSGLLMPPGDPEKLYELIKRVIEDNRFVQYLTENARNKVLKEFSINKMVTEYETLYNRIVNN